MTKEQIKSASAQDLAPIVKAVFVGLGASLVAGSALGKLTKGPIKRQVKAFDKRISRITHKAQNPLLDPVMSLLSAAGEPWTLYPVSALLAAKWLVEGRQQDSATLALSLVGSAAINKVVKSTVERKRPFLKRPRLSLSRRARRET